MPFSTLSRGRTPLLVSALTTAFILAACGGGEGGSSATADTLPASSEQVDQSAQANTSTSTSDTAAAVSHPDMTSLAKKRGALLTWTASTSPSVVGYRVYYGTAPGVYQQAPGTGKAAGTDCTLTLSGLPRGATYYFAVAAVDAAGTESALSNEVSKAIP